MNDEESKEKGKGEMLRVMRSGKRQGTSFVLLLLPLFILHNSSFRGVHHHRIRQNVQAFLLVLDLGQLSSVRHTLHHGSHFR